VNFGELPKGYLDKVVQDVFYFRNIENIHATLRKGIVGARWARMRNDRPPSTIGAGTSLDALVQQDERFKKVMLNVSDPSYVIPEAYFKDEIDKGALFLKEEITGTVNAIPLEDDSILWLRCPTLAFSEPIAKGIQMNPEFPYDAVADNKLFTYEVLSDVIPDNLPVSIPIGNRCSGAAAINDMLARSRSAFFIRKPLLGSQARGIEILRRQDLEEYQARIAHLEDVERGQNVEGLPLELRGVPELLMSWALSFDVSLLSELVLSKPVYCRQTGRYHYGCMRTLLLIKQDEKDKSVVVRFLGAYWRLALVPVDGDGLLWERYIGSQSQGAFCERASSEEIAIAENFAIDVITAYYRKLSVIPQNRQDYQEWETKYWLTRYQSQVPLLNQEKRWNTFLAEIDRAREEVSLIKQQAELAGFRRVPSAFLTKEQVVQARLPYLIKEPYRIMTP
jgi:hypothetical protein